MAQKTTSLAYAQALLELATEPWLKGLRQAIAGCATWSLPRAGRPCGARLATSEALLAPVMADAPPQVAAFMRTLVSGDLNKLDTIVR